MTITIDELKARIKENQIGTDLFEPCLSVNDLLEMVDQLGIERGLKKCDICEYFIEPEYIDNHACQIEKSQIVNIINRARSAERKLAEHVNWLRDNIKIEEEEADEYIYNTHEDRKKAFEEALENLDEELINETEGE